MTTPIETRPIDITDLWKRHGAKPVLTGCDLTVPAGSVTGLLGVNGAGKTTLLRCLLGLARPDRGTVRTLGEDAWELSGAAKSRIGYVPQTASHYGWMRVDDLLAYVGSFHPSWDPALAERLRARWDIPSATRAGRLSPGEAQRLALVLALAHRPELLVLDEPAASLDPLGRREFLTAVLEVAADGVTVLLSTHLIADLERIADRIAVLKGGRIAVQTGIDDLKEQVKRLRVSGRLPAMEFPADRILSRRESPDGAVLVVRDGAEEIGGRLRAAGTVVEVDALGLDDIAVELLR